MSFDRQHLTGDLGRRAVRGGAVTAASQLGRLLVGIGSMMILARLLTPADFGLIAMVSAFTTFTYLFVDAGLSMATIQRDALTHDQVSVLYWTNVAMGAIAAVTVACLSPAVAWFYGQPNLTNITLVMAIPLLVGGFGVQHIAILQRKLRFSTLAWVRLSARVAALTAAVVLAWLGAGVWALVCIPIVETALRTPLVAWRSGWRPGMPRRGSGAGALLRFGGNVFGANVIVGLASKLDDILVGWMWGTTAVGYYSRAYNLLLLPAQQFNPPVNSVALPTLSALQGDPQRFRNFYRRAVETIGLVGHPTIMFLIVAANEVIAVVLGSQWAETVDIFRFLGPACLLAVTQNVTDWVTIPQGYPQRKLHAALAMSIATAIGIIVGLPWGAVGVAIGVSTARVAVRLPVLWFCYRNTPVRVMDFLDSVWHTMAACIIAAILTVAIEIQFILFEGPLLRGLVLATVFFSIYLGALCLLPGGRALLLRAIRELTSRLGRSISKH